MGYFDGLLSSGFKKDKEGKALFYPNGIFGKGYIINEAIEKQIKVFLKKYYIALFITTVILINFFKPFVALISILFWMPYYEIKIFKILSSAEKTSERLTLSENSEIVAINMGLKTNIILFIVSLLLVAMAVFSLFTDANKIMAITVVLFFGTCLVMFSRAILKCIKRS